MNRIEERLSRAIEDAPSVSVEELKRADVQKMKEHDDMSGCAMRRQQQAYACAYFWFSVCGFREEQVQLLILM